MSSTRAFRIDVGPKNSGGGEDESVHQSSPAWVVTFVRWQNRDPLRTDGVSANDVRNPLVVENDCIQLSVSVNKSSHTPQVTGMFVMTDIDYRTAIAPGDFMLVNMLDWEADARRVAIAARSKQAINGKDDGFKGIFKVQGVRRTITTDPNTGTRYVVFRINGFAFTEFNNTIYFNPNLLDTSNGQDQSNQLLFASYLGNDWQRLINKKGLVNCQDIVAVLIESFIGNGINDDGRFVKGTLRSPNVHFFIPDIIGSLLGIDGVKAAKDIYTYLFGIQEYAGGSVQDLSTGLNPQGVKNKFGRFYYTPDNIQGDSFLKPEYWNQVKSWSILQQYSNSPLNEMFSCFRVSPTGRVMPTVVLRQIPFNNEDFTPGIKTTKFMNLPRWVVSPAMVLDEDIGRDEAARINFVQYFGRSSIGANGSDMSYETAQGNYLYDIRDVTRSGLRPYVITSYFDEPTANVKGYRSPTWAKIMGDCLIGGHLKFNGSLTTVGISDPISIGDNVEYDNNVYHIEQVSHTCSISDGRRSFRTSLALSMGMQINDANDHAKYSEMEYIDGNQRRLNDTSGILPGVSESQDVVYRTQNPDVDDSDQTSQNKPAFPQPNKSAAPSKKK